MTYPTPPTGPDQDPNAAANFARPDFYLTPPDFAPAAPPVRRRRGRTVLVAAAATVTLAAGAVAAFGYSALASHGPQPESVLPSTTVAFAKLDLDPAASEKVALYRLSGKFPSLSSGSGNLDQERESMLAKLFGPGSRLDYTTDVKPWLGDRVAVAAVPDPVAKAGLDPVIAVRYTDESAMRRGLDKAVRANSDVGYAVLGGYALLSDSQAHADAVLAASRRGRLDTVSTFAADLKALPGHQVLAAWVDLGRAGSVLKAAGLRDPATGLGSLGALSSGSGTGRVVLGVHGEADYLELSALLRGTRGATSSATASTLEHLDAGTTAAVEFGGLDALLTSSWARIAQNPVLGQQVQPLVDSLGLDLPADFGALLGSDTTLSLRLAAGGRSPEVAAQIRTTRAARAREILAAITDRFSLDPDALPMATTAQGYIVGNSAAYNASVAAGAGPTLADDPTFRKAVPQHSGASMVVYVNLGAVLDTSPTVPARVRTQAHHLAAFGLSVHPTSDGEAVTIRVTTR